MTYLDSTKEDCDADKHHYIIWVHREISQREWNAVVGLFYGTYEDADDVVGKLNATGSKIGQRENYFRTEPRVLDAATASESDEGLT